MFIAILIIVILLAGFVVLLRQAGRASHPLLQALRSRGMRPGTAEQLLCGRLRLTGRELPGRQRKK